MHKLLKIAPLLALLLLTGCFGPKTTNEGRSYDTAKIDYQWRGTIVGTETFYAKGNKRRSEINTVTTVDGKETRQNMLIINDGEYIYKIDLNTKLALKEASPFKEELKSKSPEELKDLRKKMALYLKESDDLPKPTGKAHLAGKDCDIYTLGNNTTKCLWEEQVLKTELVVDSGKTIQEAAKVQVDMDLDDSLFTLPGDVTVQDLSE